MTVKLYKGMTAHVVGNPFTDGRLEIEERGGLLVAEDGRILAYGAVAMGHEAAESAVEEDYSGCWLLPGFVDGHIHFPQFYATAAYGTHLLDWLQRSIFPMETRFADIDFARSTAKAFVKHLAEHGTTTAMVYGSQFLHAGEALFEEAEALGIRIIAGLTLMDRDAPDVLFTKPRQAFDDCETLIRRFGKGRLTGYAVTPRFALSCSDALFEVCRSLVEAYPEVWVQTHINENAEEIELTARLFPDARDYLDVYEQRGMLGPKTMLAHNIHAPEEQLVRIANYGSAVCHCPASNLYLGSGLFSLADHLRHGIRVCVGTDIGAGTNFSILDELGEVYKIQQMNRFSLDAAKLLYMGTSAGAEALGLSAQTGNFLPGKDADFNVVTFDDDTYLSRRLAHCPTLEDQLFTLLNLAGPRHIRHTYVAGRRLV